MAIPFFLVKAVAGRRWGEVEPRTYEETVMYPRPAGLVRDLIAQLAKTPDEFTTMFSFQDRTDSLSCRFFRAEAGWARIAEGGAFDTLCIVLAAKGSEGEASAIAESTAMTGEILPHLDWAGLVAMDSRPLVAQVRLKGVVKRLADETRLEWVAEALGAAFFKRHGLL